MPRTYKWGYSTPTNRLTLAEMETRWTWMNVHPEVRRRAVAIMDASQDAGHDVGIGEGARNTTQQLAEFFRRHTLVSSGGCCTWQGKRYALKPGMAPISPPGSSNHEDGVYEGDAIAIDFNGWEDHWFDANCERFGIKNFGGAIGPGVNGEEWHGQPVEFRNSRSDVNKDIAAGKTLATFPLPGDPITPPTDDEGDPAMFRIRYRDSSYAPGAYTGLISNGPQLGWISDGNGDVALGKGGARIVEDLTPPELDGLIATSQTTTDPPPEFSPARQAVWNTRRG